ncbi:MAG: histidine kinase [Oscillospiraceae bacterium]|nr:histidine kinase [Oscillospiraceae bacterium]
MIKLIRKLKLKDKILISYIPIVLILVTVFFVYNKRIVNSYIENQLMYSAQNSSDQTIDYIEQKIINLSSVLNFIISNVTVEEAVFSDYSKLSYYDQYNLVCRLEQSFIETIDKNDIDNIKIFLRDDFEFRNMSYTGSLSEVEKSDWYARMIRDKKALLCTREVLEDGKSYISIGRLISDKNNFTSHIAALKIYISEDKIKNVLDKNAVSDKGVSYILNEYGEVICASDYKLLGEYKADEDTFKSALNSEGWVHTRVEGDKRFYMVKKIDYPSWHFVNVVSDSLLTNELGHLNRIMVLNMLIAMILAYVLAYFISRSVNKRIIRLNNSVTRASNGNFTPINLGGVPNDTADEIDVLSENYNKMIKELENAMKQQYENGKIIKSAELKILYEQINPHFLYNVLDLINWMAINNETKNISSTVTKLADYYKLTLNKGNEIISIRNELEHVRLYFEIQKIRFENIEQIIFDVPDEILQCRILKIIFQPLLENFIKHGMKEDDEFKGIFSISAKYDDKNILFTVSDNGEGISDEIIKSVQNGTFVSSGGSGFGLKSINERLKLFYGDEYGLSFGNCTNGAVIFVKIPKVED